MPRTRVKGTKYNKVSKQQKFILLRLCFVEKKSIHEVIPFLSRQLLRSASTIQQQRPSFSSIKNNAKPLLASLWLPLPIAERTSAPLRRPIARFRPMKMELHWHNPRSKLSQEWLLSRRENIYKKLLWKPMIALRVNSYQRRLEAILSFLKKNNRRSLVKNRVFSE